MKDLVLVGCGGFAREVLQIALDQNDQQPAWNVLGFVDDDPERHGTTIHDLPVLGGVDWLAQQPEVHVNIAIGNTVVRRKLAKRITGLGVQHFATLIHPRAWVGRHVDIGPGSTICAGTMITTDIRLGAHTIANLDCTIGHDAVLEQYVTLAPSVNVSGNVTIGEGCDVGTGAVVIQGVEIGAWSIIGAGAVVVKPIPANVTAVGTPAKPIKERPAGWHDAP